MSGKIRYNNISFSFDRPFNNWSVGRNNIQTSNRSDSGIVETNEFYNIDTIDLVRTWLSGTEIEQLEEWWEYVRDGSSFEIWKDKDVAFYLSFEGKNDNTNDGDSPTFTRTGVANAIDFSTGLVTSIAENVFRTQSGKYGAGLLIEKDITNLLDDTEDFTSTWATTNLTVTANQLIAPDGTLTADKLAATAAGGYVAQTTATVISTNDGTFSVWLKCLSGTIAAKLVIGDDSPDDLKIQEITVTTEWQRFEAVHPTGGNNVNNWVPRIQIDVNAEEIYAWGAQLETSLYKTSYIADAGSRGAEKIRYTINSDIFNNDKYSISGWINTPYDHDEVGEDKYIFLLVEESTGVNVCVVNVNAASSGFDVLLNDIAGTTHVNESFASTALTKNTWHHIVLTVDTTIPSGIQLYIDGSLIGTSTSNTFIPRVPDEFLLGSKQNGLSGNDFDGMFDDVILENKVLPANEITARYNSGRALGIRRNYFSAVKITNTTFKPIQRVGGARWDFSGVFEEVLT